MKFAGRTNEYLLLSNLTVDDCDLLKEKVENGLSVFWSTGEGNILKVDNETINLKLNQVIFLTEFHQVEVLKLVSAKLVRFNRDFYCIRDHDSEVGCQGILFFGASRIPSIQIHEEELEKFEILWKMFYFEMETKDNLQIEMLQMMLKRMIILCTRIFKEQHKLSALPPAEVDIIREFNVLVEYNYKQIRTVGEYAEMLHKSPKTLSNLFAQYNHKTPLQIIQERILLEARRLLKFTDLSVKEIAYELGFEDLQTFSRLFRRKESMSPKAFRKLQTTLSE